MKKMADKKEDLIGEYFGLHMTGYCMSKAILEDYSNVIAKLEGTTAEEVKERINKRTQEIFTKKRAELLAKEEQITSVK